MYTYIYIYVYIGVCHNYVFDISSQNQSLAHNTSPLRLCVRVSVSEYYSATVAQIIESLVWQRHCRSIYMCIYKNIQIYAQLRYTRIWHYFSRVCTYIYNIIYTWRVVCVTASRSATLIKNDRKNSVQRMAQGARMWALLWTSWAVWCRNFLSFADCLQPNIHLKIRSPNLLIWRGLCQYARMWASSSQFVDVGV